MSTREKVATAIANISYKEMMDMCEEISGKVKSSRKDGLEFEIENASQLADRLRWWAEDYLEGLNE